MLNAKYIIVNNRTPVIFSPVIQHIDEANGRNITSAGFVEIFVNSYSEIGVNCYGESVSLDVSSKPKTDNKLIRKMIERE